MLPNRLPPSISTQVIAPTLHRSSIAHAGAAQMRVGTPRLDALRPNQPNGKAMPRDIRGTRRSPAVNRGLRGLWLARASTGLKY
ncbi:hypothetical protein J3F83DRAFT_730531 [Trichoderma novae-zelandiae]